MTETGLAEWPHGGYQDVCRWGPSLSARVHGSPGLARWQLVARTLCWAMGRVRLSGQAWLPPDGPAILAVNHTSAMDGTVLFGAVRRPVSFLVKVEAFQPARGLAGRALLGAAQLPVRRNQIDPTPVRLALQVLELGGLVGICPEGRRGDGRVAMARPGVGYLAVRSGAPVVPVAVHGSAEMVRQAGRQRRPVVQVSFGEPLSFPSAGAGPLNRAQWLLATEQIRSRLAELVRSTDPNSDGGRAPW